MWLNEKYKVQQEIAVTTELLQKQQLELENYIALSNTLPPVTNNLIQARGQIEQAIEIENSALNIDFRGVYKTPLQNISSEFEKIIKQLEKIKNIAKSNIANYNETIPALKNKLRSLENQLNIINNEINNSNKKTKGEGGRVSQV